MKDQQDVIGVGVGGGSGGAAWILPQFYKSVK